MNWRLVKMLYILYDLRGLSSPEEARERKHKFALEIYICGVIEIYNIVFTHIPKVAAEFGYEACETN